MGQPQPIRYLFFTAVVATAIVGAAVGVNAVIDPFGMTWAAKRPGVNVIKPGIYRRVRLAKAFDVRHVAPRAIVLGTSRSHVGLRMTHPGWSASPGYNLAFDGALTREMYAYLVHAHSAGPLKQVVLGLDTWQLSWAPSGARPGFDPDVLLSGGGVTSRVRVDLADLRILASLDTLSESLKTYRSQTSGEPEWLAPDGQRLGEVFFRRPGEFFHDASPREYFERYDRDEIGWQAPPPDRPAAPSGPPSPPPDPDQSSLAWICRIIDFCRQHDIDLRIYITPMHAHQSEISTILGGSAGAEAVERALLEHLAADAAAHPGGRPIPLWDFSGYSSVTTEPMPPPGGRDEMRYYWDSSHFKEGVGDWVLDRLFGTADPERPVPADFGVRLTIANFDEYLAAKAAARAAYRRDRSDEVKALEKTIAEVLPPRPQP